MPRTCLYVTGSDNYILNGTYKQCYEEYNRPSYEKVVNKERITLSFKLTGKWVFTYYREKPIQICWSKPENEQFPPAKGYYYEIRNKETLDKSMTVQEVLEPGELAKEIDEIKSEVSKINKKLNDLARILQN